MFSTSRINSSEFAFATGSRHQPTRQEIFAAAEEGNLPVLEMAVRAGVRLHELRRDGFSLLQVAACEGQSHLIPALIAQVPEDERANHVNAALEQNDNQTALHLAARNGHASAIRELVQAGASLDARTSRGWTALHLAANRGQHDAVRELLNAHADADAVTPTGERPIHLAAYPGHHSIIDMLATAGADLDARTETGHAAVHLAALSSQSEAIAALKRGNADMNAALGDGSTAFHLAARYDDVDTIRALGAAGANASQASASGETPLHTAARLGYIGAIRALGQAGADMLATLPDGQAAIHLAAWFGHFCAVSALTVAGADIDAKLPDGRSAVHIAAEQGHASFIRALKLAGANMAAALPDGKTALFYSICNGHAEVIKALDETAILPAGRYGQFGVLKALRDAGTRLNNPVPDKHGRLLMAAYFGQPDALSVLLSNGANPDVAKPSGITAFSMLADSPTALEEKIPLVQTLFENGARPAKALEKAVTFRHPRVAGMIGQYCLDLALAEAPNGKNKLVTTLAKLAPADAAALLASLPFGISTRQIELTESLDDRQAKKLAQVLEGLHAHEQPDNAATQPLFDDNEWLAVTRHVRTLDQIGEYRLTEGNLAKHISHLARVLQLLGVAV
jgi:ankyrin repeat protein